MNDLNYQHTYEELNQEVSKYPQDVTVIAVSKYVGAGEIKAAYDVGFRDFGENRVPDLAEKMQELINDCPDIRWHFIGNIQSNKIKELMSLKNLYAIHSVDSLKHVKMIGERAIGPIKMFIQVNTSEERQKGGVHSLEDVIEIKNEIDHYPYLFFQGLMCMAPVGGDLLAAKNSFSRLKLLSEKIPHAQLSMGMSGDYPVALDLGAHYIRVGSKIFR